MGVTKRFSTTAEAITYLNEKYGSGELWESNHYAYFIREQPPSIPYAPPDYIIGSAKKPNLLVFWLGNSTWKPSKTNGWSRVVPKKGQKKHGR